MGTWEKTGATARNRRHISRLNREKPELFNRNRPDFPDLRFRLTGEPGAHPWG